MTTIQNFAAFSSNTLATLDKESENAGASPSSWKAFEAGMQILHRFANRSLISIDAVAKSNLQTLHRALLYDAQYTKNLVSIRNENSKNGLPVLRRIYTSEGLIADLLAVKKGESINLVALPQRYTMYLLISGSAQLGTNNINTSTSQHWWNYLATKRNEDCLRKDTVIICPTGQPIQTLNTIGTNCYWLRIQIPLLTMSCKIA